MFTPPHQSMDDVWPQAWPAGWLLPDLRDASGGQRQDLVACMTARAGGVSEGPWAACNLGDHVADRPEHVATNRARVASLLTPTLGPSVRASDGGGWPVGWLKQVHGATVHRLTVDNVSGRDGAAPQADGVFTTEPGLVCAVMVADCLPILLAAPEGRGVAALHAGWRGLAGAGGALAGRGIVEAGVQALCDATGVEPRDLVAWLGPCIGPQHFQVGRDVLHAFGVDPDALPVHSAFATDVCADAGRARWLADLPALGRQRLLANGVRTVRGGLWCTVSDPARFFSYRREPVTGRQAALIALR